MGLLYGGVGRFTAKNGDFRPGQIGERIEFYRLLDVPPANRTAACAKSSGGAPGGGEGCARLELWFYFLAPYVGAGRGVPSQCQLERRVVALAADLGVIRGRLPTFLSLAVPYELPLTHYQPRPVPVRAAGARGRWGSVRRATAV
jgi:hypothetical protein